MHKNRSKLLCHFVKRYGEWGVGVGVGAGGGVKDSFQDPTTGGLLNSPSGAWSLSKCHNMNPI